MNRVNTWKTSIHNRMIIYFILILLIPLIFMGTLNYISINGYLMNSMIKEQKVAMEHVTSTLNSQFKYIYNMIDKFKKDKKYYSQYRHNSPLTFIDMEKELLHYETFNDYISEIFFVDNTLDKVYSSQGIYYMDYFVKHKTSGKNIAFNDMRKSDIGIWTTHQLEQDMASTLAFVAPIEYNNHQVKSYIKVVFDQEKLNNLFSAGLLDEHSIGMLSYGLTPLYHYTINKYSTNLSNVDQNNYILFEKTFERYGGLQFTGMISKYHMSQQVSKLISVSGLIVLLIAFIGGFLIWKVIKNHFIPLKRLMEFMATKNLKAESHKKDLYYIQEAFEDILDENYYLMESTYRLTKDKLLLEILSCNMTLNQVFITKCQSHSIPIEAPYHICIVILLRQPEVDRDYILKELFRYNSDDMSGVYLDKDHYILLLSGEQTFINERLKIFRELDNALHSAIQMGIGKLVDNPVDIQMSYSTAQQALENIRNTEKVFCDYSHYNPLDIEWQQPLNQLTMMQKTIKNKNDGKFQLLSNEIKMTISRAPNNFSACYGYFNFVHSIEQGLDSLDHKKVEEFQAICLENANRIFTIEQLLMNMTDIIQYTNNVILEHQTIGKNSCNIKNIMEYVSDHFMDQDFSIKMMAAKFNTSQSNLSHLFKRYTGQTLLSYIDTKKIEVSKELLKDGLTIKSIASTLGYANPSTFIRRFKNIVGNTPGEYRNEM